MPTLPRLLRIAGKVASVGVRAARRGYGVRFDATTLTVTAPGPAGRRAIRIARAHHVYVWDLLLHFDYYHGAVLPQRVGPYLLADYSAPRLHRLNPRGDLYDFTGLPEPADTTDAYLTALRLAPGDLVLDLGAYCGTATVAFARAVAPTGHVVAFEPDPVSAAALRANVARHTPTGVTVVESGLWSATGTQDFAAEGNLGSAVAAVLPRAARTRPVPVLSLADAAAYALTVSGLPRIAAIKADIEGAELAVFDAGGAVLTDHRPRLVIEPHGAPGGALNTGPLRALLHAAGYTTSLVSQGVGDHPLVVGEP